MTSPDKANFSLSKQELSRSRLDTGPSALNRRYCVLGDSRPTLGELWTQKTINNSNGFRNIWNYSSRNNVFEVAVLFVRGSMDES